MNWQDFSARLAEHLGVGIEFISCPTQKTDSTGATHVEIKKFDAPQAGRIRIITLEDRPAWLPDNRLKSNLTCSIRLGGASYTLNYCSNFERALAELPHGIDDSRGFHMGAHDGAGNFYFGISLQAFHAWCGGRSEYEDTALGFLCDALEAELPYTAGADDASKRLAALVRIANLRRDGLLHNLNDVLKAHADNIARLNQSLKLSAEALGKAEAEKAAVTTTDESTLTRELKEMDSVMAARYESYMLRGKTLTINTRPIFIDYDGQRYPFGKFRITINLDTLQIRVTGGDYHNADCRHPHVNGTAPCFGDANDAVFSDLRAGRYAQMLEMLYLWLTSYGAGRPYRKINTYKALDMRVDTPRAEPRCDNCGAIMEECTCDAPDDDSEDSDREP